MLEHAERRDRIGRELEGHARRLSEGKRRLRITALEPCLALHRRSWCKAQVVTVATLIYPASRYAIYSRHKTDAQGKPA